jgi:hypothetical protein
MQELKPVGVVVCMPTRGVVAIETMLCLREHLDGYPHVLKVAFRKPVVEARNQLAKEARELNAEHLNFDPKYVLWVDDDAWWPYGTVDRAVRILEENPDVSVVSGLFCAREGYAKAVAGKAVPFHGLTVWDVYAPLSHEVGELLPLDLCGGHWFIIRRDVLKAMGDDPFDRLPIEVVLPSHPKTGALAAEDLSFFRRLRTAGYKIVTERTLRVGHVDVQNGLCYFPDIAPRIANGLEPPKYDRDLTRAKAPPSGKPRFYHAEARTARSS